MTLVSELLAVKIENLELRKRQVEAIHGEFQKQQQALIEEARREVDAPAGHLYNTDTRTFQAPGGSVPLSTRAARQAKRSKG